MPAAYLRIFRLLWTIKHVEAVLEQARKQCWPLRACHAAYARPCQAGRAVVISTLGAPEMPRRRPLLQCWDHINSAQRALATLRAQEKLHGVEVEHAQLVPPVLRAFHARRAEMASFLTSLQYYIAFEVLEPNWGKLSAALPRAADLDAVIALHEGTLQVRLVSCMTVPGAQGRGKGAGLFTAPGRPSCDLCWLE